MPLLNALGTQDTQEKTLVSLQSKLIKKLKLSVKNLQNWIFGNNGNYLAKKFTRFRIFPRISLLTHTQRHSNEDFRKFSAKANDKILSYRAKIFKKLNFCQKCQYFAKKSPILNFPMDTTTPTRQKTHGRRLQEVFVRN